MADDPSAKDDPKPDPKDTPDPTSDPASDGLDAILKDAKHPDAVKNAIDRQKEAARAEKQRADELAAKVKEFEDRDKTEQQKLEERASTAEKTAAESATKLLRYEVAAAKGVPLKQAHRLQGTTKEELEADADEFLKDVKQNGSGGQLDGGARGSGAPTDDMDTLIRRAAGRI